MELIYVITRKCNLYCTYCPVSKKKLSISREIINHSWKLFTKYKIDKIKFFGGEPLLEYQSLKYIVKKIRSKQSKVKIFLTTNGLLLNQDQIEWIKNNNINLTISLDGNELTQSKNRRGQNSFQKIVSLLPLLPANTNYNLVIAPQTAKYFFYNFSYLLKLGIRRFNFLPAYYNSWSLKQLKVLTKNFNLILYYINKNKLAKRLFLKNLENYSKLTFFNQALVIDCDGKIYNTNAILTKLLEPYKKRFAIGNIFENQNIFKSQKVTQDLINSMVPDKYVKINQQLDEILNDFIYKYKKTI